MSEPYFGITTRCYGGKSTEETARLMAEAGFKCCEICFVQSDLGGWTYNGRGDLSGITPEDVKKAADVYRAYGVEPVALGVFTNISSPDEAELAANIDYFIRHMDYAEAAGTPVLSTECGFTPGRRGINADTYEADFARIKGALAKICSEAERRNLKIALEGCVLDIVPSPKRMRDLAAQLKAEYGITNFTALLDGANFIAAADEEDMFKYLSGMTAYIHGKDRHVNDTYGCNLGDGEIDWVRFFALYKKYTPGVPFVLEYPNAETASEILRRAKVFAAEPYGAD